ncbi:Large proline-rich protein bag6, partial [Coemansia sp. RSA 2337]
MSAINWRIRVKALMEGGTENEFQVDVRSDETVGDFRGRLATTSHVEPQKQRLIYRGRLLVDDAQKLVDVGVSDGSALHMVARPTAAATAPAPTAATTGERGSFGTGNGREDFLSNLANLQPTPFALTPLATQ